MRTFLMLLLCSQLMACGGDDGNDTRQSRLDEAIPRVLAQTNIPGVIVGVWQGGSRVYLPDNNSAGQAPHWDAPEDDKPTGLIGFLGHIVQTMQNWRDQIQLPYPGYRDRIVQVSQRPNEGGLNLNMPKEDIGRLADAGEYAAEVLTQHFDPAFGHAWANHKDIRVRSFLTLVEELVRSRNLQDPSWDQVVQLVDVHYLSEPERTMALHVLSTMRDLGQEFDRRGVSISREPPKPKPQLRISPRI